MSLTFRRLTGSNVTPLSFYILNAIRYAETILQKGGLDASRRSSGACRCALLLLFSKPSQRTQIHLAVRRITPTASTCRGAVRRN
jgi:hypothetical protein